MMREKEERRESIGLREKIKRKLSVLTNAITKVYSSTNNSQGKRRRSMILHPLHTQYLFWKIGRAHV